MSLRRSTRLRAGNPNPSNNKENTLDSFLVSKGKTNPRRSTKNTTEENTFTLGLQRPDGEIVHLRPSYVLGRSNQPPQLPRVDLGLTNANAIHVSKTACVVESVTAQQAVLVIPKAITNKRVYKPKISRGGVMIPIHHGQFTLQAGDILIFPTGHDYPNHSFPVVRVDATVSQGEGSNTPTFKATKGNVLASKPCKTLPPSSKTTDIETVPFSPNRGIQRTTPFAANDMMKSPPHHHHHCRPEENVEESPAKRIKTTDMQPSLRTTLPPAKSPCQPIPLDEIQRQEQDLWRAPELVDRHQRKEGDVDVDDDGDNDNDDYDCHDDLDAANRANSRPRDMHVTFANTYWKALCSDAPSIGAKLLHLLLDNQRLPTIKLCRDLIQLVTFGEDIINNTNSRSKTDAYKTRRNLAYQYIEATLYQYPQIAYDRFGDAAGSDYWKNVLEQLYTIKHDDDHHSRRNHDHITPERMNTIAANLEQQVLSLKLFYRLLNGMINRHDPTSSPVIRDMHHYGPSATCKVAANVMAHVWVEWGTHLWISSNLTSHVYALTNLLAKIMILLLQKFMLPTTMATTTNNHRNKTKKAGSTNSNPQEWKESTEILWNAMNSKMQLSPHHRDKQWALDLKFYWIHSWKNQELEETLAKHLKLWKEYKET